MPKMQSPAQEPEDNNITLVSLSGQAEPLVSNENIAEFRNEVFFSNFQKYPTSRCSKNHFPRFILFF